MIELPLRDLKKSSSEQGLFHKFHVQRMDGKGSQHQGCDYFVIDVNHDPFAKAALWAYARACRETHPQLAEDMVKKYELPASSGVE